MRLTIIVQNYPPECGPVRYTRDVAVALASRGHEVTVITGVPHYPFGKPYSGHHPLKVTITHEDDVRVIRTPLVMGSNSQITRRLLGFLTFAISAWPWLLFTKRSDVIIASVPPLSLTLVAKLAALIRRQRYLIIVRDVDPVDSLQARGFRPGRWSKALITVLMKIYAMADLLVLIHPGQERTLKHYGISTARSVTITHSVDVKRFLTIAANPSGLQLPKCCNRVTALYLGTIGVSHDLQGFLSAIVDSRIANLPIDFAIVGDGECLPECRSIVENARIENARFYPPIPLEEVPNVLTQADLLIASFRNDLNMVISSKIYEYCAAGRPIIVFGECAAARLVADIGNGWVCADRTPKSLYDALTEYLSDPEGSNERGRRGVRYVMTHFAASTSGEKWNSVLQDLVKKT